MAVESVGRSDIFNAGAVGRINAVGQRIERGVGKQCSRDWTKAIDRNDAAGEAGLLIIHARRRVGGGRLAKLRARQRRVAYELRNIRKIALPPGRRSDADRGGAAGALHCALIIGEEEELILHDRTAERPAEDVLAQFVFRHRYVGQRLLAIIEPAIRIELIVTNELEYVTAPVVCPRLQGRIDRGAGYVAEFR